MGSWPGRSHSTRGGRGGATRAVARGVRRPSRRARLTSPPPTAAPRSEPSSGSTSSSGRDADRDRLAPDVERDMLTIVGELAMGWLDQAADRAERLCDRLVAQGG